MYPLNLNPPSPLPWPPWPPPPSPPKPPPEGGPNVFATLLKELAHALIVLHVCELSRASGAAANGFASTYEPHA